MRALEALTRLRMELSHNCVRNSILGGDLYRGDDCRCTSLLRGIVATKRPRAEFMIHLWADIAVKAGIIPSEGVDIDITLRATDAQIQARKDSATETKRANKRARELA